MKRASQLCMVAMFVLSAAARDPLSYATIPEGVYVPPKNESIMTVLDLLKSRDDCSTLVSHIETSAGMRIPSFVFTTFSGLSLMQMEIVGFSQAFDTLPSWSFTFFAPSNAAFRNLGSYFETYFDTPKGKFWFGNLLQHHYVPNSALKLSAFNQTLQRMQTGSYLFVGVQTVDDGVILNGRARVVDGDLAAGSGNGLVHVIDHVLDPSAMIFEADLPQVKQAFIAGSCADRSLGYC
jgi:hypothetical protein